MARMRRVAAFDVYSNAPIPLSNGMGLVVFQGIKPLQIRQVRKGYHGGTVGQARERQRNDTTVSPLGFSPLSERFRSRRIDGTGYHAPDSITPDPGGAKIGNLREMRLGNQFIFRQVPHVGKQGVVEAKSAISAENGDTAVEWIEGGLLHLG